jgi:integrase/recombinase XerD
MMSESTAVAVPDHDVQLIALWLHGRPASAVAAYRLEIRRFLAFAGKAIAAVTLADVQAFANSLAHLAPASRSRALAAVKSLLAFGVRLGLLPVNVGAALRLPAQRDTLAERILPEGGVHKMLALESNSRNHALLRLLNASGCRVSELTGLRRRDLQERDEGGQTTVFGKGGKTRSSLLPPWVWSELLTLRGNAGGSSPSRRARSPRRICCRR